MTKTSQPDLTAALANINRLANDAPGPLREVGFRFIRSEMRPYTENGGNYVHARADLMEIVSVTDRDFTYRYVRNVEEHDAPSFATTPTGGTMMWFGYTAGLDRGDIQEF